MTDSAISPIAITSILVPLDGSALAEAGVDTALALAHALQARLTLLHVLEHDAPATVHGDRHLTESDTAFSYLTSLAARCIDSGVTVDLHVHNDPERDVADSIVAHADELGVDLIAMANHGSGGLRGLLFGRVAQQVLARGSRPVLVVPVAAPELFVCQRIGVLLSGSPDAEVSLPVAAAIARACDARLHLIRVTPTISTLSAERAASATLIPAAARAVLDLEAAQAEEYLAGIVRRFTDSGLVVESSHVRGDPAQAAVAEALRIGADLLALASHGRSGLSGIWAGSIGAKVLSRFDRPLLFVRSPR